MNCKFHPEAESVSKCARCGADMCFFCNKKAFFRNEDDDKPLCLNCSVKKAKVEFAVSEEMLEYGKKRKTIALILWFSGLPLLGLGGFGILFLIAAAIIYEGGFIVDFASKERGFTEKIKSFLLGVLMGIITCPFFIIKDNISNKKELKKAHQKLQDVAKVAIELWSKKSDEGDACSQYNLGELYFDGDGVTQNYEKAIELWEKAAEQNYTEAICRLGVAYNEGEGVYKDLEKAVECFTKAALLGDPFGQFALGSCYSMGEGVPQDDSKAVEWYFKAAQQGHAMSQCSLGICYRDGKGVTQDMVKAFEFWKLAADQGDETALELIAENS